MDVAKGTRELQSLESKSLQHLHGRGQRGPGSSRSWSPNPCGIFMDVGRGEQGAPDLGVQIPAAPSWTWAEGNREIQSLDPKSLRHLHGRGRGHQGAPELGALVALKHAGLLGQAGMVKALRPLWWAHHEVLAFWGMLSPPLTWRPDLCQLQFFLS